MVLYPHYTKRSPGTSKNYQDLGLTLRYSNGIGLGLAPFWGSTSQLSGTTEVGQSLTWYWSSDTPSFPGCPSSFPWIFLVQETEIPSSAFGQLWCVLKVYLYFDLKSDFRKCDHIFEFYTFIISCHRVYLVLKAISIYPPRKTIITEKQLLVTPPWLWPSPH